MQDMHLPKSTNMNTYDISLCIDKHLTDEEKCLYLKNTWTSSVGFDFPIYTIYTISAGLA